MKEKDLDLNKFKVGTYKDFKTGLITREVYRIDELSFEIHDFSNGWVSCIITLSQLRKLISGELQFSDLEWK